MHIFIRIAVLLCGISIETEHEQQIIANMLAMLGPQRYAYKINNNKNYPVDTTDTCRNDMRFHANFSTYADFEALFVLNFTVVSV